MKTRDCTCEKCVSACKRSPGKMLPYEAERIAKFLELPFDELKKKLIKNYHYNSETDPLIWEPRKVGMDEDEEIASDEYTNRRGTCVFLKNDRCTIHEVKPFECRISLLCEKSVDAWPWLNKLWKEYYKQQTGVRENGKT